MSQPTTKADNIDTSKIPDVTNLTASTITESVHLINSSCPNERSKFIFKSLVQHLHDFVRETNLTTEEWMTAIHFLTDTGKKSSDLRQEFILLSDTLGVSTLIDILNNAKPPGATEATVLGPFFTEDAHDVPSGESIASEGKGDYLYVHGRVTDTKGNGVPGAVIETWETDGHGLYDNQYPNRDGPECRGRILVKPDGNYSYRAVVPVPYPIPGDGPVGKMINHLNRHIYRPAHLHAMIKAEGFETLTTALYVNGDKFLGSDAVFGVKTSLAVDLKQVDDVKVTKARGFPRAIPHKELHFDFIMATPEEGAIARQKLSSTWSKA
ncbi:intradiol ring-cleavage dioxygenase [Macrolepiota fuliginosa MF-IS2]|uniref:Intradiol ring-cleavage dioxygenase n=1 Tax=Macrolepiota fuliginosa MF-IS2 TaxID=1400762 RepID=A0A9P6C2F2_9AGAR|nr:intradiol ring-cleavage dioxygenase [Macrolepiota fuliginosa MF-IS2]